MAPFKPAFIRMLIETSRDFSLRSVAQHPVVGPAPDASTVASLEGGDVAAQEAKAGGGVSPSRAVARAGGGALQREDSPREGAGPEEDDEGVERADSMGGAAFAEAARRAATNQPPEILRGLSEEMVER